MSDSVGLSPSPALHSWVRPLTVYEGTNSPKDRVFTHALSTVRLLPRTPSSPRPPASERLKLYGLYKQAMEGDVERLMPRPTEEDTANTRGGGGRDEMEKWDAWHTQAGTSKTEAKRRYISTLIQTMRTYASGSAEARELIAELEFVWDQIKSQPASSGSPSFSPHRPADALSHNAAVLRVLPPQSSSAESSHHVGPHEPDGWKGRVEATLSQLTAEVAALREELQTPSASSLFTSRVRWRRRTVFGWIGHFLWQGAKHLAVDLLLLALVLAWLRRKGDRRVEEKLRSRLGWWGQWAQRRARSVRQ